jgi:hypothetical protein
MTHHGDKKLYEMIPDLDEILPINEVDLILLWFEKIKNMHGFPSPQDATRFAHTALFPIHVDVNSREQKKTL